MSNLQQARQTLAELLDEQCTRQQAAVDATQKRRAAAERVAQLRAQQALDGVNLSRRITAGEQEIASYEDVINMWPDVSAELDRRIATAQQAICAAETGVLLAEFQSLQTAEPALRLTFAQALLHLAQVGQVLNTALQRKIALKTELHRLGRSIDAGNTELPIWNRWGIGQQSAVDEAVGLVQLATVVA